jgi:glucose-6-phosphate 1-dehydrogenase
MTMHRFQSDALSFFGPTGDLAYKIFPALQEMSKSGTFTVQASTPVHGYEPGSWGRLTARRLRGGGIQGR